MIVIDTHSHLYKEQYEESYDQVLQTALESKIFFFNAAYNMESSLESIELAKRYPKQMKAMVGIHPNDVKKENIDSELKQLEELIIKNKEYIVAIGEIGLDYFYEGFNKEVQIYGFKKQIELAIKYNLSISIHCRESIDDVIEIVNSYGETITNFVFHTYASSLDDLKKIKSNKYFISFSGTLTYKKNEQAQDVIRNIDKSKIVFETDAPWLSPMPYRGKPNLPWYINETILFASVLLDKSVEELNAIAKENVSKLFGVSFD